MFISNRGVRFQEARFTIGTTSRDFSGSSLSSSFLLPSKIGKQEFIDKFNLLVSIEGFRGDVSTLENELWKRVNFLEYSLLYLDTKVWIGKMLVAIMNSKGTELFEYKWSSVSLLSLHYNFEKNVSGLTAKARKIYWAKGQELEYYEALFWKNRERTFWRRRKSFMQTYYQSNFDKIETHLLDVNLPF